MEGLSLNMFFFCMNIYNNIIVTARLLQGWGGGGYAPRRKLYETLVLFVVYFVLKINVQKYLFLYKNKMHARRKRFFFQRKNII